MTARESIGSRGGIDTPCVMGSASTHVLSGLGAPLKRGDVIGIGGSTAGLPLARSVKPEIARKRLRVTSGAQTGEFDARQAISLAVDRKAFADAVYLGAATPVYGPVTPANKLWYSDEVPHTP